MTAHIRTFLNVRAAGNLTLASVCVLTAACGTGPQNPTAPSPNQARGDQAIAPAKVEICHRTEGTNAFVLLSVAQPAVEAHQAHGDGLVGAAIPGMPGMNFGADCAPVASAPMLDQSNITFLSFGGDGAPGSAVNPTQSVAQTFTVGLTGVLATIDLGIYRDPAANTGDVTLDIVPAGALPAYDLSSSLFTTTIPIGSIPLLTTNLTSVDVSAAQLSVNAGDQLAIVLRRQSGPSWVVWQDSALEYSKGSFFTWHPGWTTWMPVTGDHRFQTWVIP
jgi:hypothetical protein